MASVPLPFDLLYAYLREYPELYARHEKFAWRVFHMKPPRKVRRHTMFWFWLGGPHPMSWRLRMVFRHGQRMLQKAIDEAKQQ